MKTHKKKIFSFAKGFYGRQKNCWTIAVRAVHRAWQKAYVGRKQRKRLLRSEWIQRINAGARQFGLSYSQIVRYLPSAGVDLNRKVLADIAATEPYTFRALVEVATKQREAELAAAGKRAPKRRNSASSAAEGDATTAAAVAAGIAAPAEAARDKAARSQLR